MHIYSSRSFTRNGKSIIRFRPAWRSYWGSIIAALCVVIAWGLKKEMFESAVEAIGFPFKLSVIGLILGLTPILATVLYRRYTRSYEIEEGQKIRLTTGFIARQRRAFDISDKVQIDTQQSVAARLLNFGTIAFWTGDDKSRLEWQDAPDPDKISSYIDSLKRKTPQNIPSSSADSASGYASAPQTSIYPPTLLDAKTQERTHFGAGVEFKPQHERAPKRIATPFGHYVDNDNGTISHQESGLMWIRAPWGMVWANDQFHGEPICLTWKDATDLFGKGAHVGYEVGATHAAFGYEKKAASEFSHGYNSGRCIVDFAGHYDWRLPTGSEIDTMTPYHFKDSFYSGPIEHGPGLTSQEESDWCWDGSKRISAMARLYPEFSSKRTRLWTATGLDRTLAWAFDGKFPVGDHLTKTEMGVMFVRKITPNEVSPVNTVDENLDLRQAE